MTREEAREAIKEAYGSSEYADEIIKALEQEPCGKDINVPAEDGKKDVLDKVRAEVKTLPNANPSYSGYIDVVDREDVLEIIDKYKEESEEKK